MKVLFADGWKFFIINVGWMINWQTDNLVISHFLGASQVTPYAVAFSLVQPDIRPAKPGLSGALASLHRSVCATRLRLDQENHPLEFQVQSCQLARHNRSSADFCPDYHSTLGRRGGGAALAGHPLDGGLATDVFDSFGLELPAERDRPSQRHDHLRDNHGRSLTSFSRSCSLGFMASQGLSPRPRSLTRWRVISQPCSKREASCESFRPRPIRLRHDHSHRRHPFVPVRAKHWHPKDDARILPNWSRLQADLTCSAGIRLEIFIRNSGQRRTVFTRPVHEGRAGASPVRNGRRTIFTEFWRFLSRRRVDLDQVVGPGDDFFRARGLSRSSLPRRSPFFPPRARVAIFMMPRTFGSLSIHRGSKPAVFAALSGSPGPF